MKIVLGTRKSPLAMAQALEAMRELRRALPGLRFEIKRFDTPGDRDKKTGLIGMEGSDFFTRDIDEALKNGIIDMAVHSAKDLPADMPGGLTVAAITKGVEPGDVLVLKKQGAARAVRAVRGEEASLMLRTMKPGAKIGTSSERRILQLKKTAPRLKAVGIRGNINERLAQLDRGKYDGLILAAAGLLRLGQKNRIAAYLPFETAPMQGRLAVVVREKDREMSEAAGLIDERKKWGTVYIAGAGPGDPELMSVKTRRLLDTAGAVVYDSLAKEQAAVSNAKIMISAGKRKGRHEMEQAEINAKLAGLARSGLDVVRLKGGDPCVFGRGHEEAAFLRDSFIKYEIVPGITAASAAACYAEAPLTQRNESPSVILSSAHPENAAFIPGKGYKGTVAYYMAATAAAKTAKKLISAGWKKNMPAVVVSGATLPGQKTFRGTLGGFARGRKPYPSPALFIAGSAAGKTPARSWFDKRKKVLFTGTLPERYRRLGGIIHRQMIKLVPLAGIKYLKKLGGYSHVIFTSRHAVMYFFAGLARAGLDARALAGKKVCSIGSVTTDELIKYGVRPDIQPFFESAAGLVTALSGVKKARVLIPRSNLAHDALPGALKKAGNRVDTPVIYRNVAPEKVKKGGLKKFDTVVFTSPSGVVNFKKLWGNLPPGVEVITTGEATMKAVKHEKIQAVQDR